MNMSRLLFPIALALVLQTTAASGQELPSVAVFQLETRGAEVSQNDLDSLSDYLSGQAGEKLAARVADWKEVLAYLRTKDLYMCMDRRCQMDVERQLGADYSLIVTIAPMGKICLMNAILYASQSPASLRTAMQRGPCGAEHFVLGIDKLMDSLASAGPLPPPKPGATAVAARPQPVKRPPPVQRPQPVQRPKPVRQPDAVKPPPAAVASQPGQNEPPAKAVEEKPARTVDGYPRLHFSAGLMYAPAPLLLFERKGSRTSRKIPDHYGAQIAFEWRFAHYLLLGGQTRLFTSKEGGGYDGALRFGGYLPLNERLTLLGYMDLGLVNASVDVNQGEDDYSGYVFDLGLGLRYYLSDLLALNFSLTGSLNQLMLDRDDSTKIVVLRLEAFAGLVFGW